MIDEVSRYGGTVSPMIDPVSQSGATVSRMIDAVSQYGGTVSRMIDAVLQYGGTVSPMIGTVRRYGGAKIANSSKMGCFGHQRQSPGIRPNQENDLEWICFLKGGLGTHAVGRSAPVLHSKHIAIG